MSSRELAIEMMEGAKALTRDVKDAKEIVAREAAGLEPHHELDNAGAMALAYAARDFVRVAGPHAALSRAEYFDPGHGMTTHGDVAWHGSIDFVRQAEIRWASALREAVQLLHGGRAVAS